MQSEFNILLASIFGVLFVASLIGGMLRRFYSPDRNNDVIENLVARINAWWVMVGLLAISLLAGEGGVVLLFALLSFGALREFYTLTIKRRTDYHALLAAFFVILPYQYWLIYVNWYGLYSIFIPVYGFFIIAVLAAIGGDTTRYLARVAEAQWGLMICVYALSHVPALLNLDIAGFAGKEPLLIAYLVLVVQGSDVLQYIWGKLLGKHKIAPALSPSKTWEGFVGGVASATALGAALYWITPFAVWQSALMALMIALLGFLGGLVMSAIKRDRGIKDWGHLIAGHGGVTDRIDSLTIAAPVFFHMVRYFWAG